MLLKQSVCYALVTNKLQSSRFWKRRKECSETIYIGQNWFTGIILFEDIFLSLAQAGEQRTYLTLVIVFYISFWAPPRLQLG